MRSIALIGSLLLFATAGLASDADLVTPVCSNGVVIVTAKEPWHINPSAPWKWDKGSLISRDHNEVKFKGPKCEGTVKAFIVSGDQPKGPINIAIK